MQDQDRSAFAELLTATLSVYNAAITQEAIDIWWRALAPHDINLVRAALSAHVRDPAAGRFAPKPADVIAQIVARDGRPTADEAWAQCPLDEKDTAVWTEDARAAFYLGAYDILKDGDRIAARMAFKGAYDRVVQEARARSAAFAWRVSLGTDKGGREAKILTAAEAGKITVDYARKLLPYSPDPGVALRLEGLGVAKRLLGRAP